MPQYADPNMVLAERIGAGLSGLFGPKDNSAKMKYLLGASEVAGNNAHIAQRNAAANLDTQTHENRAMYTPDLVGQALQMDTSSPQALAMANLIAASLGQGGNAEQAIGGLNSAAGGQIMRTAQTEGEMRRGFALDGNAASAESPLSAQGIAGLFGHKTALNDADNATSRANQQTASAAARYGHDRDYEASVYGTDVKSRDGRYEFDNKPWSAAEGATLFNRSGNLIARGTPKAGNGADGAGGKVELTPLDFSRMGDEVVKQVPNMGPEEAREVSQRMGTYFQINGGDPAAAVRQAIADIYGPTLTTKTRVDDGFLWDSDAEDEDGNVIMDPVPLAREKWAPYPTAPAPVMKPGDRTVTDLQMPGVESLPPAVRQAIEEAVMGKREFDIQMPETQVNAGYQDFASMLPPEALAQLVPGEVTEFGNGQHWILLDGKPSRVK